jgi:hypothetical protein
VIALLAGLLVAAADSLPVDTAAPGFVPRRRLDAPALPMVVRRFDSTDLEASGGAPRGPGSAKAAGTPADTSSTLRIDGEKTIRVGVGGEGGVAVDQTLRLDASGEIAPGVQVRAHLSDQQVPLGSEGSTEALRELDEVFLQVKTRRWDLVAGDQDWSLPDGATPGTTRRLRGLSTGWNDGWTGRVTTGSPRARWMRMVFEGVEGRQEGWILPGPEGRTRAPVVPGSERVRIGGSLMQPGTDYVLRAAEGVIDFLPRRRISGHDRIEVEWQAAVLDYQRGLDAARVASSAKPTPGLGWEAWALRERDDPTRALSFAPTSEDDSLLRLAGADASLAVRADTTSIPLPIGLDDVGFRLGWTGTPLLETKGEWRGTRRDRNLASGRDAVLLGSSGTLEASSRAGSVLSAGGAGILGGNVLVRANDAHFHPIAGRSFAGQADKRLWNDDGGDVVGEAWETSGGLSWEAEPGLGVWTTAGARGDSVADAERASLALGLRDGDRRILTENDVSRRDETRRTMDRWASTNTLSWPVGPVIPRLVAQGEDRQAPHLADGVSRTRLLAGEVGGASRGFDGRFTGDLAFTARREETDRGGTIRGLEDSSRSRGARALAEWIDDPVSADALVDAKLVERKSSAGGWIPDQTWLGESRVATRLVPGVTTDARWLLSMSDFLPEIATWDTVPPGTGTHRWDSISRQVVRADDGNLVSGGTRIDTTRAAVRSARRSLSLEATFEPGLVWEDLEGLLADIGLEMRGQWEEADSSGSMRWIPHWTDADLARAVEARSSLESALWWSRGPHRLDLSARRDLSVAGASLYSTAASQRELEWRGGYTWSSDAGHRLELPLRQRDRVLSGQDLSRREILRAFDPALVVRVARRVDLLPSALLAVGSGHDGKEILEASVVSPALGLLVRLGRSGSARSEIRWARASTLGPTGSGLSEGYLDGRTWRASAGLDWKIDDHFSASADWVLRRDPGRESFQKASAEARAVF